MLEGSTILDDRSAALPITRLNHAVLYVRDVNRSVEFYTTVLGFRRLDVTPEGAGAAFLQAAGSDNDHDLGLFEIGAQAASSEAGHRTVGLYHLAWEVDTLGELATIQSKLLAAGALVGSSDHSTTKSLYGKDPDGIEFEIVWLVPADRLTDEILDGRKSIRPLDLAAEQERYGVLTPGGTASRFS